MSFPKRFHHQHQCDGCGLVWEHPDDGWPSPEVYREVHHCPGCGDEQRSKYWGDKLPDVAHVAHYELLQMDPRLAKLRGRVPTDLLLMMHELDVVLKARGA